MQVRLPDEKLTDLKQKLLLWQERQVCSKKELLSFACKVVSQAEFSYIV